MDLMLKLMPNDAALLPSKPLYASSITCPYSAPYLATSSSFDHSFCTRRKLRSCLILAAAYSNIHKNEGDNMEQFRVPYKSALTQDCTSIHPGFHCDQHLSMHRPQDRDHHRYDPHGFVGERQNTQGIEDSGQLSVSEKPKNTSLFRHNSCDEVSIAGVGLPLSLKMLKRKQKRMPEKPGVICSASGFANHFGNSLQSAFSSMVFMMKTLQSHTLIHIKQHLLETEIIEGLVSRVNREMHASLLWLFQQVFACTPQFMILIMVFLTDFTVFSMSSNLPPPSHSAPLSMPLTTFLRGQTTNLEANLMNPLLMELSPMRMTSSPSLNDSKIATTDQIFDEIGWFGNGGGRPIGKIVGGGYGDSRDGINSSNDINKATYSIQDKISSNKISGLSSASTIACEEFSSSMNVKHSRDGTRTSLRVDSRKDEEEELITHPNIASNISAQENITCSNSPMDQNMINRDRFEEDKYPCYDRTDLAYQYALSNHDSNMDPMVLANYAQFMFLVRKDHDRAEELFNRALQCDPTDGDTIHRFASFLWLARDDRGRAEKAYESAISIDPKNPFFAASYAHFLWDSHKI